MALEIKKIDNVFCLGGRLNSNQVFQIRNLFEQILNNNDSLTICLRGLDDVDLSAALMFKQLKDKGYSKNKAVEIINGSNNKILGPFRMLDDTQVLKAA